MKTDLDYIKELNTKLNKYPYYFDESNIGTYKVATPSQFRSKKKGMCWEYVGYEAYYFSKYFPNIKYTTYFIMMADNNGFPSHTFLVFKWNNDYIYILNLHLKILEECIKRQLNKI